MKHVKFTYIWHVANHSYLIHFTPMTFKRISEVSKLTTSIVKCQSEEFLYRLFVQNVLENKVNQSDLNLSWSAHAISWIGSRNLISIRLVRSIILDGIDISSYVYRLLFLGPPILYIFINKKNRITKQKEIHSFWV